MRRGDGFVAAAPLCAADVMKRNFAMFFKSGREALGFTAFMVVMLAIVFASVFAIEQHWMNPVWVFHPVFLYIFLFTVIPASWNRGAFWPCHPRVMLGSVLFVLTVLGLLVQFPPAC